MDTFDFGSGPVPAYQHPTGGGWVADTATVAASAYVGPGARVYGDAQVSGRAMIYGSARVCGDAWVYGAAQVCGDAWVYGGAQVCGAALICGAARISSAADILTGYAGGYPWAAYRCSRGWRLRYGCEVHPPSEWRRLHVALAVKHTGSTAHAEHTRAVEALVRAHIDTCRSSVVQTPRGVTTGESVARVAYYSRT